jgi:hypothetical protein
MAKFSQAFLQGLLNPSYQQGLFEAARGLGQTPGIMRMERQRVERQAEIKQLLQENINNPAKLQQLAQEYLAQGQEDIAKAFTNAATQAIARQETEKTELQNKGEIALFNMARMMQASPEEDISRNNLKRQSYLEIAKGYKVSPERAIEILEQSVEEKNKGSEAKGYKVEKDVLIDGKLQSVVEFFDAQGTFLNRKVVGEVVGEEADKDKPFMETKSGSDLYNTAVAEKNTVSAEIQKFDSIITQAEKLADELDIPVVGGVIGAVRDFAVSDIAGLGDDITAFRTSLNEVQMQKALALLPRGPASDRDVQLALNASPDLKNYNEEERLAALRGMKKILEARKQYVEGKVRWMEVTNDANAVGYERYAEIKGFDRNIEDLKTKFPTAVQELDSIIIEASKARQAGDDSTYQQLIQQAEAIDSNLVVGKDRFGNDVKGLGYINTLKNRGNSRKLLDRTLENRGLTFEDINYV